MKHIRPSLVWALYVLHHAMLILVDVGELGLHQLLHMMKTFIHRPRSRLTWPCRPSFSFHTITLNFHHHRIINDTFRCTNFLFFIPLNPSILAQFCNEMWMWKPLNALVETMYNRVLNYQPHINFHAFHNSIHKCSPTFHDGTDIRGGL